MLDVYVIGIGGVGQKVLEDIPQMMAYECKYNYLGKKRLTLIDGDSFEAKNLTRQKLVAKMVGQNKAESYARMISKRFEDLEIRSWGAYLMPNNIEEILEPELLVETSNSPYYRTVEPRYLFILMGVDSLRTRKMINDFVVKKFEKNVCLISGGNELVDGNVQIYRQVSEGGDRCNATSPLDHMHDEIKFPPDRHRFEMSCDELRKSSPQLIATNRMVATAMTVSFRHNYLIMCEGKSSTRDYGEVHVNIDKNVMVTERT